MNGDQLQLVPDVELSFRCVCFYCGRTFAAIPVDGSWHEATCWGWLAHHDHALTCEERRAAGARPPGPV